MSSFTTFMNPLIGLPIFLLSGIHCDIITVSKVSVRKGGSVSIPCYYEPLYQNHVKYLCKGYFWVSFGSIDGTTVKINMSVPNIFTVTMSDLRTESSGWYWGAVGDLQIPVHIIVHKVTSATTTALHPNTSKILQMTNPVAYPYMGIIVRYSTSNWICILILSIKELTISLS
uniref:Immunoglobulin V-set domain-containing protein n=1 Tax=Amphilophus citrinellus TaxID=61819 RepID=A0A3Q0QZ69_AMPCI